MADDHMSWRKQQASSKITSPSKSTAKASKGVQTYHNDSSFAKSPIKRTHNWRSKGSTPARESPHNARLEDRQPRNEKTSVDAGPAAPLNPLHMGFSKPLPHPATYGGSDNWALTPTGSLPSLPATPSRAMNTMGWHNVAFTSEEHRRDGSGSRELSAARALLNRRNEELPGTRTLSPAAFPGQSPKRPPRLLQSSSPSGSGGVKSPTAAHFGPTSFPVRPVSPADEALFAATPSMTNAFVSPPLRHRDSNTSVASSSLLLGAHVLSHSRRTSQNYANSPASSVLSSSMSGPGYRVYRPPHLRRKDSIHALKPKVAHYDRVRTPSLRGQSRSPDPLTLSKRLNQDGGTPAEASLVGRPAGRRRLSSLGSFHSSMYDEPGNSRGAFDHRSLFAKLASNKNRKYSDASSFRADDSLDSYPFGEEAKEEAVEVPDDVDLSAEDVMTDAYTLTDEYCMSRTASMGENGAVVDIFQIGDRIGAGMMHDGLEVTIAETSEGFKEQNEDLTGSQLEVVKKLGEGSYAVVYLVKEVTKGDEIAEDRLSSLRSNGVEIPKGDGLREGEEGDETVLGTFDVYGTTLKATAAGHLVSQDPIEEEGQKFYALKCLCKRDLTDEMLQVQRLEATIHQSIPPHPCIVTLYRTFETAEWLFLILEYCPGQDLFFWLEQASDSTDLGSATPSDQGLELGDTTAIDATPPSPSLLASTESRFLLSTRRLRLISRMFQQMCQAVDFCHRRGISHRDIKPENFIVEDTRSTDTRDSIKVKLTDFGLAVAQEQCIDFDCGSKPYMSYECRNNRTKWYDPRQSDIWSLGIVLFNLIFHRNPFAEPNVNHCPSFASYVEDPIQFLLVAFRGLKREAAQFLAENVFCDVTQGMECGSPQRRRISAKEFGDWASNLSKHLESPHHHHHNPLESIEHLSHGADQRVTSPLWSTRSPAGSSRASPLPSHLRASIHEGLSNLAINNRQEWESYDGLQPEQDFLSQQRHDSPASYTCAAVEVLPEVKEDAIVSPAAAAAAAAHDVFI